MIFIVDVLEIRSVYDLFICFPKGEERVPPEKGQIEHGILANEIIRDVIF